MSFEFHHVKENSFHFQLFLKTFMKLLEKLIQFLLNSVNFIEVSFKFSSDIYNFFQFDKFLLICLQICSTYEIPTIIEKKIKMNFLMMIAKATYRIATFHVQSKSNSYWHSKFCSRFCVN